MGKRSNKPRVERDFYPTPEHAVLPLDKHLSPCTNFDEPCCGDGALQQILESMGHRCQHRSDIEPQCSAAKINAMDLDFCASDVFITNPPYTWKILDPLITHLSNMAPTWLLLPADMMHNKRMSPHMEYCEKVVSIGRVKWFGNQSGMENSAWYLFDKEHTGDTKFYARCVKAKNI